ncbi:type I polyketide synthase [Phaeobacter sp. 22II1-1F12B]|uniref:type I polyketide synthase n=1 Tax=Phaeobacter sp. 22II1-1F12B TaxID=1317111 RepID=UPI000B521FA5|nr:type I polyketide synthase [Phaeobacter sp. 22II1-1F12B]
MSDFLKRISSYSPKRLALLAARQKARIDELEKRSPIAIVGMGCRFPGGADTPAEYWSLIKRGEEAITEVPKDRWDVDAYYDPDPDAPGKTATRWGGWIKDIDKFDPQFFGIAPREAQSLDPQQRLWLEVAWAALEDAGIPAKSLFGTRTGVFCGVSGNDYHGILRDAGHADYDAYTASGIAHSMASGRLSYVLGTTGPSVSVDTACSSSLVAIHQAVQSLRRGECDAALAGGVNLILTPETTIALSRSHMMAPDGRCKTFDARADGFVRGEGCGVLILKRLADAQAANDRIVAVISGSAINQDGRSNGLTAPNGVAQQAVIKAALEDAGVEPGQIGFVETHGTGTALGDPIEVHALGATLCPSSERGTRLRLGSVKSQIGHLESAAGVAGVIKAALSISNRILPGQVNLKELNPLISWNDHPVEPQRTNEPWPDSLPLRAGVSSFGFSGTNVHVVVEPAPAPNVATTSVDERQQHLLTVSARSSSSLANLIEARRADLVSTEDLANIAHVANAGRDHHAQRIAVVAHSTAEADALLTARDRTETRYAEGVVPQRAPKLAFVFSGQGAQYAGMASGLYASHPVFRAEIDRCAAILEGKLPVPLLTMLESSTEQVNKTAFAQPALFAVEWALAKLWRSWGVEPQMVLGHSLGEYVAACVAGVFSLEEALHLVAERGALMQSLKEPGAMSALRMTPEAARDLIAPWREQIDIAAINGPQNVVISGALDAMDAADKAAKALGVTSTRLHVSHAFHSPLMEPILNEFEAAVSTCNLSAPVIPLISNLSGQKATNELLQASYWREHVRSPVRFADGLKSAKTAGARIFLEIGPHPALLPMGQANLEPDVATWLTSLRREHDDLQEMLSTLARLYVAGVDIDWRSFDAPWPRERRRISGYPFERSRYWIDPASRPKEQSISTDLPGREIIHSLGDTRLFEIDLNPATIPWLYDQSVHGRSMLLSTYQMDWAWQVAQQHFGCKSIEIRDFLLRRPLQLSEGEVHKLQLSMIPKDETSASFRISARQTDATWVTLCEGTLGPASDVFTAAICADKASFPIPVNEFYANLEALGINIGGAFRTIDTLKAGDGLAVGDITASKIVGSQFLADPVSTDTALQVIGAALDLPDLDDPYMIFGAARIIWHAPLTETFRSEVNVSQFGETNSVLANVRLVSPEGTPLVSFKDVTLRQARAHDVGVQTSLDDVKRIVQKVVWRPDSVPTRPSELVKSAAPVLKSLSDSLKLETDYGDFLRRLDTLSSGFIEAALNDLGIPWAIGDQLAATDILSGANVLSKYQRLVSRMLEILAEDGTLKPTDDAYQVVKPRERRDMQAEAARLLNDFPECAAEIELTQRCGKALAEVLRGQTDPLTLLFPEGSLELTQNLYELSPPARAYTAALAEMIRQIAENWPHNRRLRILEIGAGTGSATARILEQLGDQPVDYVFTDISPLFLNRARSRFEQYEGMDFRPFDISLSPTEQGFAQGSFDVILAGNVIHATPNLETSLGHIRDLLAPEGVLLMLEATKPQRFGDLTVGMLEGWWAYEDTSRRSYALLPQPEWLALFDEMGFREVGFLPAGETRGALAEQTILAARRPAEARANSRWIISPGGNLEHSLKDALEALGDEALIASDSAKLHEYLNRDRVDGIIHLGSLDTSTDLEMSADAVVAGQKTLFEDLLGTVHALTAASGASPRLCIVTRGGQATHDSADTEPAQATVWGFSHTLAIEHPEVAVRRIDLDPDAGQDKQSSVAELADAVRCATDEDQFALRGSAKLVRRLVPARNSLNGTTPDFPTGGTCLITGGLGGLGLATAEWLVSQGVKHVALLGRSAPNAAAQKQIDKLTESGAEILVLHGDVSNPSDVERCLDELADALPPVAVSIHAAGGLADAAVVNLDWPQIEKVMQAKVAGTLNLLHFLPQSARFIMFSSGASLAGSAGQANHAAANAFEDALAFRLRAAGRDALTINWGLWADIGAGARQSSRGFQSLLPINPKVGLQALGAILASSKQIGPQVSVIDANWREVANGQSTNLFAELIPEVSPSAADERLAPQKETTVGPSDLPALIAETPRNRQRTILESAVRDLARKVLGVAPEDDIDINEPLQQRGLDSLMAVELRNLLNTASGLQLHATVTFEYPSIAALAKFIGEKIAPNQQYTQVQQPETGQNKLDVETASEEDLATQLALQLDRLDRTFNS